MIQIKSPNGLSLRTYTKKISWRLFRTKTLCIGQKLFQIWIEKTQRKLFLEGFILKIGAKHLSSSKNTQFHKVVDIE